MEVDEAFPARLALQLREVLHTAQLILVQLQIVVVRPHDPRDREQLDQLDDERGHENGPGTPLLLELGQKRVLDAGRGRDREVVDEDVLHLLLEVVRRGPDHLHVALVERLDLDPPDERPARLLVVGALQLQEQLQRVHVLLQCIFYHPPPRLRGLAHLLEPPRVVRALRQ